jgi:hypothetical protein
MKKLLFLLPLFILTSCASINYRVVGWYSPAPTDSTNQVLLENGQFVTIVGNPRLSCYTRYDEELADGIFVKVQDGFIVVDEWGTRFVWIPNNLGNYCILGGQN